MHKQIGAIGDIKFDLATEACIGIGHTRWATHGGVTRRNAHPHYASDKSFVLAQNGIVENYQSLKAKLSKEGYPFISETDTEVIVRLIEHELDSTNNLLDAVRAAFTQLEGRNTIAVLMNSRKELIAVRNGSPLVVGIGQGEYFLSSDTLSFADKTDRVVYIEDNELVHITENIAITGIQSREERIPNVHTLQQQDSRIGKEGHDHFMIKEIIEQQHTIVNAVNYPDDAIHSLVEAIKTAKTVYTIGAGTASYAAGQIAYYLRRHANVHAIALKAYETGSYENTFQKNDLIIAVSQSGETADTIDALEVAQNKDLKIGSIVNMMGSTISRMSNFPFYCKCGPEICVASTKAFTAQIAWGFLIAHAAAGKQSIARKEITRLSDRLKSYFTSKHIGAVKQHSKTLKHHKHLFILGKEQNYQIALEATLKIKEISYMHVDAC